jgi:hypothetical protein
MKSQAHLTHASVRFVFITKGNSNKVLNIFSTVENSRQSREAFYLFIAQGKMDR